MEYPPCQLDTGDRESLHPMGTSRSQGVTGKKIVIIGRIIIHNTIDTSFSCELKSGLVICLSDTYNQISYLGS